MTEDRIIATDSIAASPRRLTLSMRLKQRAFNTLEYASRLRYPDRPGDIPSLADRPPIPSIWLFISTIGELNAVEPFLHGLKERDRGLQWVLITDHAHYRDSYMARYPHAVVAVTRGQRKDASRLAASYPPEILIVVEIPAALHDAPCRFSFSFLFEAKRRGAAACLINGWLYGKAPSCRMDAIEHRLFQRDYLRLFDAQGVQRPQIKERLLALDADRERVHVTGNIKFDAMRRPQWSPAQARSPLLLQSLIATARPIIVAGCVTDYDEQHRILDAFDIVKQAPDAPLLVIAPRHPEYTDRMHALKQFLRERNLRTAFRSEIADGPLANGVRCLVLDTMGELRDFYAAATIAHVGVDHNLLEPLAFEKSVTVCPGWEPTYPSYPVYRTLSDVGAITECSTPTCISTTWLSALNDPELDRHLHDRISSIIPELQGAAEQSLLMVEPWLTSRSHRR